MTNKHARQTLKLKSVAKITACKVVPKRLQ